MHWIVQIEEPALLPFQNIGGDWLSGLAKRGRTRLETFLREVDETYLMAGVLFLVLVRASDSCLGWRIHGPRVPRPAR